MLPSQYARIIHRALANPNSGIKRPTLSAALPTDAALYYTTAEAADLTRRPRTTLITILHKLGVRFVTGDYVGNIKSPTANYWLKEDIHANLSYLTAPELTTEEATAPAAKLPLNPALYYTTNEVMQLTGRLRPKLIALLREIGIRNLTGKQLGLTSCSWHCYWLKEDVDANLHALKPTYTARKQKPTPNLATHTTLGKARTCPAGHPGRAFYSAKEAAAILSVSRTSLSRLAKKHNLTVEKRQIFTPNTNHTHIQSFFLKKEIHSLAKQRSLLK